MKKLFLIFTFISGFIYSQEVIYEGNFKGDIKLGGGVRLLKSYSKENKMILVNGKNAFKPQLLTLDTDGKIENLDLKPTGMSFQESSTGKTKVFTNTGVPADIYADNKYYQLDYKFLRDKFNRSNFHCVSFNDNFVVGLGDEKGDGKVNLNKEKFYVHLFDFRNQKSSKNEIQLPNLERYTLEKKGLPYSIHNLDNDGFDFVTKNVTRDFKKCTVYLTRYNLEGKITSEKEFIIDSGSDYLLTCNNGAGQMDFDQTSPGGSDIYKFNDNMFVNNIYFDDTEKTIYIYGLYGKNGNTDINDKIKPDGYYVYKFSNEGKLIWKKYNIVDYHKDFNSSFHPFLINNYFFKINDKLCFTATADRLKHYIMNSVFDMNTGNVISQNEFSTDEKTRLNFYQTQFLYSGQKLKEFPNKLIDRALLAKMYIDPKIFEYVKSVENKKEVIFNIVNFDNLSIVIETDNSKYFKFTKFKL